MATRPKKHDTITEIAAKLPSHRDSTGQLTSSEARGFPRDSDGRDGYHSAGTTESAAPRGDEASPDSEHAPRDKPTEAPAKHPR